MIKIDHLVKSYGANRAVDDISFEVAEGEIVGLPGPNGAGKSTTMNILAGYLSSTSGRVLVDGKNVLDEPLEVKKRIGYLPEQPPLYLDMTVEEYLNFSFELKACKLNKKEHLAEICEVVKIKDVYKRLIKNLSKGYRQRVGIAQALIGNPDVLILDEPTDHLDMESITALNNGLIKFPGVLLFASRDHQVVQTTANRIMEIVPGGKLIDKITTYDEYLENDEMARKRQTYTMDNSEEDN